MGQVTWKAGVTDCFFPSSHPHMAFSYVPAMSIAAVGSWAAQDTQSRRATKTTIAGDQRPNAEARALEVSRATHAPAADRLNMLSHGST